MRQRWFERGSQAPPNRTSITLVAESTIPEGWMAGDWGGYRFRFTNRSDQAARLVSWSAHWEARDQAVGQPWSAPLDQTIPADGAATKDEIGFLPPEIVDQAEPDPPMMVGSFVVEQAGNRSELSFRLPIPAATLPEPLALRQGQAVGLALMASRSTDTSAQDRALGWLDQAYAAMTDLTGCRPDNGALLVLQESPANPYYAYAGNPIILNTRYVGDTLDEIAQGQMPFGWIHEVGHTFDVFGAWYNWNAATSEFQANFKLAYAFEHITLPFVIDWRKWRNPAYPHPSGATLLHGRQFVDALFTTNGDAYLADPRRGWESMTSDELHSCFQRIQRVYGWEPFRNWYRAYGRLAALKLSPPASAEAKIQLAVAILSHTTGADLTPVFARWRLPVTAQDVQRIGHAYRIEAA